MCRQGGSKCELDVYQRYNNTRCVFSRGCALFGAHVDDEQVPKISSEISPHINDKQLGRLNSYQAMSKTPPAPACGSCQPDGLLVNCSRFS